MICEVEKTMAKRFPPMGMSPAVWGPIFWSTMHIVTMGYPPEPSDEQKAGARSFFESLASVIPCPICREHYAHFLKETPPDTTSRDTLVEWAFNIHNKVNEQLGYRQITFEQFVETMRLLASKHSISLVDTATNGYNPIMFGVALGIVIGVGGYTIYHKYSKGAW